MKSFEEIWKILTEYAKSNSSIETLVRRYTNQIEGVNAEKIVIKSLAPRASKKRTLSKSDFRQTWNMLVSKGSLVLSDIDPRLRGKRAIIFAFLSKVKGITHSTKPLTLRLNSDS